MTQLHKNSELLIDLLSDHGSKSFTRCGMLLKFEEKKLNELKTKKLEVVEMQPKLFWNDAGLLALRMDGKEINVSLKLCFPWSEPTKHLSLRDSKDKEVYFVHQIEDLDSESQSVLREAVAEAGFVLRIAAFISVEEKFELRHWVVKLSDGQIRHFQTKGDEWPFMVPGGGFLIRDVSGDLYYLEKPNNLDKKSRALVSDYID